MYGWRARIGVILPLDNTILESEYQQVIPEGVSVHILRLSTGNRESMLLQAEELAQASQIFGPDILIYACAETSFFKGKAATLVLEEKLSTLAKCPVISATGAMIAALKHLKVTCPAVATPYPSELGLQFIKLLNSLGYNVTADLHRPFDKEVNDKREWWGVNVQKAASAYRLGREVTNKAIKLGTCPDVVLIAATNFATFDIIKTLEGDINLPVITSNQALIWAALRKIGIPPKFNLGTLIKVC